MEYPFKDLMPLDEVLAREGYYKDWTHLDPEVFYSLTQISNFIKTKGYGVDVRLLIAQLAEHFGLKTTQVVDLANLLQQKFTNLEGVTQSFTSNINSLVAQMEADKDAVIANVTVDSEVILARGGKPTLQARLDDTATQLAQIDSHVDTTFKNSISDKIRKVVSDTASGTANGVFIEVGDSTRASRGAHIFGFLSNELSKYNVKTHLVAQSGLKAEHWSKYTANMQPGFPTVDDVIALVPGDGTNTIVDICLGINDGSKTQEQMQLYIQTGIDAILSVKPNVLINLTSPNRYSDGTVVNKLINVYKNLSETGKYGYINVLENVFRTWNSDVQETYFEDTTHPNVLGQTRMADYIIPKFLPNYKTAVSQNDDITVLTTGDTPVNYYVELATITLKRRYYGFNGTILVQASPGDVRMPNNAMFAFSVIQYAALGTDADKEVTLKPLINETNTLNFTKDSLVLRTVSVSPSETVVKIYLKNTGIGGRHFKVVFFGAVNGSQEYTDVTISNILDGRISMEAIASGTTDVSASYNKYSYLSSPDGSLFKIAIDNSGTLSGTKV